MLILVLIIATVLIAVWFIFMSKIDREDWISAAYNKVLDNILKIEGLKLKDAEGKEKLSEYHGTAAVVMKIFLGGDSEKEIRKLEQQCVELQGGNLKSLSIMVMPGYVIIRKFNSIINSSVYKNIMLKHYELYGKKHAENKTKHLLAKLISYPIIGVAILLAIGALFMSLGKANVGIVILIVGTILVLVLVYAMYDDLSDKVNKRRDAIARQFPNAVSKLALLVTSGMIMDKAWKETAYSNETQLYREMQKTSEEIDNLVSPEAAYGGFINRCNTKETAKLASAIIQSQSKGNKEIGILLKEMAKEAWLERRHIAKRDSEKANSLLMIPTMLLFIAILVMLMVPVAMNFSNL